MPKNNNSKERIVELCKLNEFMDDLYENLSAETKSVIAYFDTSDSETLNRINNELSSELKKQLAQAGLPARFDLSHINSFRVKSLLEESRTSNDPNIIEAAKFAKMTQDRMFARINKGSVNHQGCSRNNPDFAEKLRQHASFRKDKIDDKDPSPR